MKAMAFLLTFFTAGFAMAGGTGDIGTGDFKALYNCGNEGTDLDLGIRPDGEIVVRVGLMDESERYFTGRVQTPIDFNAEFTIYAISREERFHGSIGEGLMLNMRKDTAVVALWGFVEDLNCMRAR